MTEPAIHQIAIAGFTAREREAIDHILQVGRERGLPCQLTHELGAAALIVADADNANIMRALRARPAGQAVLLIGHADGGSGWPVLPRRFRLDDMLGLVRDLLPPDEEDEAVNQQRFAATQPFAALQPEPASTQTGDMVEDMLAFAADPGDSMLSADSLPTPLNASSGIKGPVLVVDDSEIGLRLLQRKLDQLGLQVVLARSEDEALQCLTRQRFSHVFMDTLMSHMQGFKTCRAIRQLPFESGQAPRLILVTGAPDESVQSLGRLAGCDGYLQKPFRSADLVRAMQAAAATTVAQTPV